MSTNATGSRDVSLLESLTSLWRSLPCRGLFIGLVMAWTWLFTMFGSSTFGHVDSPSLFVWLWGNYESPFKTDEHGPYVPLLVLGLMIWKWRELRDVAKRAWWPGLVILAMALGLHVVGYTIQQQRLSTVGFFLGLYALMGCFWGPQWLRATVFPIVLFVFAVPIGQLADSITAPLQRLVSMLSVGIAHGLFGIDVMREGNMIFNAARTYQYDVAPACSGIRSLTALGLLVSIYAFIGFREWWKRFLLLVAVAPLAVVGNASRIVVVIIAGDTSGQETGAAIEQKLGFITFLVSLGGVLLLGWWLERPSKKGIAVAGVEGGKAGVGTAEPK